MFKRKFTVKKQLNGAQTYKKWDEYSSGDIVVGTFIGTHICQYKKENYKVKVEDAFFKQDEDHDLVGKTLVLNNCGSLAKAAYLPLSSCSSLSPTKSSSSTYISYLRSISL